MANCHNLFLDFNSNIKLTDARKTSLKSSRKELKRKIVKYFEENKPKEIKPKFGGQGSFTMDTIVNPIPIKVKEGNEEKTLLEYDIDYGVYFIGDEDEDDRKTIETYHNWIYEAVKDHTDQDPIKKNTCVRVIFADGHNIDLPIYYKQKETPELAHKKDGWILSDPLKFVEWFESKVDEKGQLRRTIRYVKAWSDYKSGDMPSGLILTILFTENIHFSDKDDVSLLETLKKVKAKLDSEFKCKRPTTPKDEDLFSDYSETRKTYFLNALESIIKSGEQAIENPNQKEACQKWQKHFGDRFPCNRAKDEIEDSKSYASPAILTQNAKSA